MPNRSECKADTNGDKCWYLNNQLHREDGPAIEYSNGNKYWYLNGQLHRVEVDPETGLTMPAIERANGDKRWYLNGELHRVEVDPETGLTMSAIEYASGYKSWCLNGRLHREDGPAIENANGDTEYWINGNHIPQLDNKRIYGKEKLQKFL